VFEKFNIAEIIPLGEKFDPNKHQAISMLENSGEPNTVISVLQKGYTLNERVLRPALVTVAK
jgi:molecular chaperone GrpE